MVNYNPAAPTILGQEWVPIKDRYLIFGENQTSGSEVGTTFELPSSTQINNARFYLDDFVYGRFVNEGVTAAIYATGTEAQSGPIQKLVIPCTSGSITGGITFSSPATDVPTGLSNPGTIRQSGVIFNGVAGFTAFRAQFGVMQQTYAEALVGKRIVGVTLVTQVIIDNSLTVSSTDPISSSFDYDVEFGIRRISENASFNDWAFQPVMEINAGDDFTIPPRNTDVTRRDRLGNFSMFGGTMMTTADTYPWTYAELTKFDSAFGASSVAVQVLGNGLGSNVPLVRFTYMALEVYFCEEKRLAYGTQVYNAGPVPLGTETRYTRGANIIQLYDTTGATNPVLPAGEYTLTVTQTDFGDNFDTTDKTNVNVRLNGIRELYTLPSFSTKEILLPTIIDDTAIGTDLEVVEIVNVPQLSLHLSGGAPLAVHPYGRQAAAQIYGSGLAFAIQELADAHIGVSAEYPWVRFYARRWGDTLAPLDFLGINAMAGFSTSITPAEFDALPETLDGWKEVTLLLDPAPTMGTVGTPTWQWESQAESNGNRWEILAAVAPALSGVSGNLFNLTPTTEQLYDVTYYEPTGATQELEWMPQGIASPWISGAAQDDAADAFLIFSKMPEAVSGFSVTSLCQPISGIGQACDIDPCCIPSAIVFNQLTWSAPSSGWSGGTIDAWEIQRMDTVDDEWQTIMLQTPSQDGALSLTGDTGSYAYTADAAAFDITGNIDISVDLTTTWVVTSAYQALVHKWDESTQQSYGFALLDTGALRIIWTTDGTNGTVDLMDSDTIVPFQDGHRGAVRVMFVADNGAGGKTARFFIAPTNDGPWSQLGSDVVDAGTTSIFSGTGVVEIGTFDNGINFGTVVPKTIHSVTIRNSAGAVVGDPDFAAQVDGTTNFTDSHGNLWFISDDAELIDGVTTVFNDFEARIGVATSYRIRLIGLYGFEGPWSDEVSALLLAPGVIIGCPGGHILTFTSNERQSGAINLAYSSVWFEQNVTEDFTFPEASFVQLQPMYDRDFFTAFRPTERGGEQFTRTVLVQAAAIDPETLADFRSLRDMAWENVSYICVRDEDGNRWFATVAVPGGRVLNNRRLYMAPVQIAEVTATPSPVDLAATGVAGEVTAEVCDDSFDCSDVVASDSFDRTETDTWGSTT